MWEPRWPTWGGGSTGDRELALSPNYASPPVPLPFYFLWLPVFRSFFKAVDGNDSNSSLPLHATRGGSRQSDVPERAGSPLGLLSPQTVWMGWKHFPTQ